MERFNPYKLYQGAYTPNWLLERTEVSQGAKLCYARLCQYAGKDGLAYPSQDTLAKDLGVEERQVQRYLRELRELGLIEEERRGLGETNRYHFLRHEWTDMADQGRQISRPRSRQIGRTKRINEESSSSLSDLSDHPQKPPPPAAESVVTFLSTTKRNEQVAALIDLAKVNDVTLKGGPAAAIVRNYGHGREVIDAFFAYLANRGVGEVHEYMIGVLRGRGNRAATGYRRAGEQADSQMEMVGEGGAALTWDQYQAILKEQGVQSAGAGDGHDAEQGAPEPVPEREAGGHVVQRTGGDDG